MWSDIYQRYEYGARKKDHDSRFQAIMSLLNESGLLSGSNIQIIPPDLLPEDLLQIIHSEEYLRKVKEISVTGIGDIDPLDTPGFKGIYEFGRAICGALVTSIDAIHSKKVQHTFSPTGGFHHASYERGGGFCIFNDIAAAVYRLKHLGYRRILVADFDAHHGNGTQSYFYDDSSVMHISFHEDPDWMYPHDGHIDDIGAGKGRGYNINMPFPMDAGDMVYIHAFDELVPPLVEFYKPDFIILIPGLDAHFLDPLPHFQLTTKSTRHITEVVHHYSHEFCDGRLAVASGGGYNPISLSWGAATVLSVISGLPYSEPQQAPPLSDDAETWEIVESNLRKVKELVFSLFNL